MDLERTVAAAFILIAVFLGIDVLDDLKHGGDLTHILLECFALLVSSGMLALYLVKFVKRVTAERLAFGAQVAGLEVERDSWRKRSEQFLNGLGQAIDEQFQSWGLSRSEMEIGLLILKGLSHKEIAQVRKTSERTVRQQAAAIYAKARLENKAQLSAFFLEDLTLPAALRS